MAITGNKGEWSELYALLKLLGDGKVHAGDANMNKLKFYYPVISVLREESKRLEFKPNIGKNVVVVVNGKEVLRLPMATFVERSKKLLFDIKAGGSRAFRVPDAEAFMRAIGCEKLKAPSTDKSDITLVIHDLRTGMAPQLGFSIKSQLGSQSSLLNASRPTNITYRVVGGRLSNYDMARINAIEDHLPRMKAIFERGFRLEFEDIENDTFRNNLLFIDTSLPQIVADCLVVDCMPGGTSHLPKAVEIIAELNRFGYTGSNVLAFYEHKLKSLLLASALGMKPATEWTGRYDANGGYLVVRTDGEIVCYHFYNVNDVEDYLYQNTHFEHSGRHKNGWGDFYRGNDGELRIKLNLQIRFDK